MTLRVREVSPGQGAVMSALVDLHRECLPTDDLPDFTRGYWWLAYLDGKPVGFGGLYDLGYKYGYLCRSGVAHSARGKGIQKRLIAARERKARALGLRYTITDTQIWNLPSSNSLISAGYRLYEPQDRWAGDFGLCWRKRLDK